MSNETEKKILEEDAERIEADRQKWIVERKRQRGHFHGMKRKMNILNRLPGSTSEQMWKEDIEPKLDKE